MSDGRPSALDALERGRRSYDERAWGDAHAAFALAAGSQPLAAGDLELQATSAFMLGDMEEYLSLLESAHQAYLGRGEALRAARCAFSLGVNLAFRGEPGRATGWFGRANRLVDREGGDCVERGYLQIHVVRQHETSGDYEAALLAAREAADTGERFGDRDLFSLAVHAQGLLLIKQGRVADGLALLDEAMVSAVAGELSPIITGVVYCGVISGCQQAYEPRRAKEWTDALARWCDEQPDMVAFSGRCLTHRAEIMQLHGAWPSALEEAKRARDRCERAVSPAAAGQALYQQGEVLRLQGDLAGAEAAYREANRLGCEPQPGLALLRLAQGDHAAAAAAVRRALGERTEPLKRARLLPAVAEILLATGDGAGANDAAAELEEIATRYHSSMLDAVAAHVRGSVQLAAGDAQSALVSLRRALNVWQELEAPHEEGSTRVLVGLACRALADEDGARLELEAATALFARLGAVPDRERVASLLRGDEPDTYGLTPRELEVLRLVAAGNSNRQIAEALVLSEHTVARHLQNIRVKLRVPSRTAATAFAFEHDLV
jgi:DNA-binding CsgD family transcriptional regulator